MGISSTVNQNQVFGKKYWGLFTLSTNQTSIAQDGRIQFDTVTGNLSISSNQITLLAGYTYELEAAIQASMGSSSDSIQIRWYNETTSSYFGQIGPQYPMTYVGGTSTQPVAKATISPTVNTVVSVKASTVNGTINPIVATQSYAHIKSTEAQIATSGKAPTMQVYTTTGANTWTKPYGLSCVEVTVVGGGGGGGASNVTGGIGGGGGGGGTAIKRIIAENLGTTETATVGAGGGAGSSGGNGSNGGTSSFGSHCSATGGTGGNGRTGSIGFGDKVDGGIGSGGDINISGGDGCRGSLANESSGQYGVGGTGGNSFYGGIAAGSYDTAASNGNQYGGGAAGHAAYSSSGAGGTGANGIVIVKEFYY